jgi:methanogenic corrinoid protein MtbC1
VIRWCAHCQTYLGESPPYEDFTLTHGLCGRCKADAITISEREVAALRWLGDYFTELRHATRQSLSRATDLLDRGLALGLRPHDLMMGMLQPALYDMGRRWAAGLAQTVDEEALTRLAFAVIELAFERRPELATLRRSSAPAALLAVAPGNAHTLGLRIVEYVLVDQGVPVHVLEPQLSTGDLIERVRALRPRVLGVSASMRQQLAPLREVAESLRGELARRDEPVPVLVAGGGAFRIDREHGPVGFRVLDGPTQLRELAAGPTSESTSDATPDSTPDST